MGDNGAEAQARRKQFDYKDNSTLTLASDARPRQPDEPSGEPQTLAGRIDAKQFGDRATARKPDEESDAPKRKSEATNSEGPKGRKRKKKDAEAGSSILEVDAGGYKPKSNETRAAFQALLTMVSERYGDQPGDILRSATEEVISNLKEESMTNPSRQSAISKLLGGKVGDKEFARMVSLGKIITDFKLDSGDAKGEEEEVGKEGDGLDDDVGVAVEFDEDEEEVGAGAMDEDDEDGEEAADVDDEGADSGDAENDENPQQMHALSNDGGAEAENEQGDGEEGEDTVTASKIDAYWLQREISRECGLSDSEAQRAKELADQAFSALESAGEMKTEEEAERYAETELVPLLDYDKFKLIKKLVKNRAKIVWCMKLASASDKAKLDSIETEMGSTAQGSKILESLRASRTSAKDRQNQMERSIRNEARQLRDDRKGRTTETDAEAAAAGRRILELDELEFKQGSHLMSNKQCELPRGSYRSARKGYEEVHVPALKQRQMGEDERLVEVSKMPEWSKPAFANIDRLNRIQSRVYESALFTSENILLCAPTGAGKTNVALLTILQEIGKHMNKDGSIDLAQFKIVYVAPMKALVSEMVQTFSERLDMLNITVKELTGDITLSKREINDTQIIVTTPEKWDIVTRKAGDRTYTDLVQLLVVDEIHLLHDGRGPVLESIVARTVRQVEATQEMTRIVGLSATLPNYDDVAMFLRVDPAKGLFAFDGSYRPCPLEQQFIGISVKKPLQRLELSNEICYEKVMEQAGSNQVLIFVHSRKETSNTARHLRDKAMDSNELTKFVEIESATAEILKSESQSSAKSKDLQDLLPHGFAIHHAGLSREDRQLVEDLFADGHIQTLVSTSTLAWGVNLPAHTVIIKGTQVYSPDDGCFRELSPLDVQQMMGRAGRPQYDSYGEGIIITSSPELQYYLSLLNQQLPVESQFISRLQDSLNAECVLGTIDNAKEAAVWLQYTYLYIRMLRHPTLYGIAVDELDNDPSLEARRADLVHTAATNLERSGLLKYDRRTGEFQVTDLGRISSHYYVTHTTLASFTASLKPNIGDIELLKAFTLASEFKNISVRENEKLELSRLMERVPVPIKESSDEPSSKVNILLQTYISGLSLDGFSLMSDMVYVTQSAGRLFRCIFELSLKKGFAIVACKSLNLCKSIQKKMWNTQTPLRQFRGLNTKTLARIEKKDSLKWQHIVEMSSQEIGELIRHPQLGKAVHKLVHQLPRVQLNAQVQPLTRAVLKVDLTVTPDFQWDERVHGACEPFLVLVEDGDGEVILHSETILIYQGNIEDDHFLSFTVPLQDPLPHHYFIRVVSDRWIGAETSLPVQFTSLILPEKAKPPTELLDLHPLTKSSLQDDLLQAVIQTPNGDEVFNPIQTQTFPSLYQSNENVLVAAPTGSDKITCGEFAILKAFHDNKDARVVYIAPVESLAKQRYADWKARIGKPLGKQVSILTGDTIADKRTLERSHITVTTPVQWDQLTRRWKQRKSVRNVSLLLVDEMHLIGSQPGPTLEICVSRMRHISSQVNNETRIVALSNSISDAKDVGDWVGAKQGTCFNFDPGVRPNPLEISIRAIDISGFEARMQAMSKQVYKAIKAELKPTLNANVSEEESDRTSVNDATTIVFAPTRKHAKLTALDILTHASSDGVGNMCLGCTRGDMQKATERIRDPSARYALSNGIGLIHEALSNNEVLTIEKAVRSGAARALVATASMCWRVSTEADLVVVKGTQHYDASGRGGADYPITELVQMVSLANRRGDRGGSQKAKTATSEVVILCHAPKKEYYKKFLVEALPVESHLQYYLNDHVASEIVNRTVENKQDAVDYLTWTFMYRRLIRNPNYYNLAGTSHSNISEHLSELVENTLNELQESSVIEIEDEMNLHPLNLGLIASHYYITHTTIELFSKSLNQNSKLRSILEILANSSEFEQEMEVRPHEDVQIEGIIKHSKIKPTAMRPNEVPTKAHALLQSHFNRDSLQADLEMDRRKIVLTSFKLVGAMVDVIASNGWLNAALAAMELSQMLVQGLWSSDSALYQLPFITDETVRRSTESNIETIYELLEMDDHERKELLNVDEKELERIAQVCNRYPSIELSHSVNSEVEPEGEVSIQVDMEREMEGEELAPVDADLFPAQKEENWWLVVGNQNENELLAIKRVSPQKKQSLLLTFQAPSESGEYQMTLFFMCDSYIGCDQEQDFTLHVSHSHGGDE